MVQNRREVTERELFTLKMSRGERELADALAQHYGQPISVMLRLLMVEKARQLGLSIPPPPAPRTRKKARSRSISPKS